MTAGGHQYAAVDPAVLTQVCESMGRTVTDIRGAVARLRPQFVAERVPLTALESMLGVADAVEALLPGLRRRVALANEIEAQSPQLGSSRMVPVVGDGLGGFPDAQAAIARAHRLAARLSAGGLSAKQVERVEAEIARHARDPDFAPAFLTALGPGGLAKSLSSAVDASQPRFDGHVPGDSRALTMWAGLFATAGPHGLTFDRAWFGALYDGLGGSCTSGSPLTLLAAVLGHARFSATSLTQIAQIAGLPAEGLRQIDGAGAADRFAAQSQVLDALRAAHVPPLRYRALLSEYWAARATAAAGIDADAWDPSNGVEGNRDTIPAVYAYYGRLFLAHPELRWAGMANLVGPGFAAGFLDLSTIRSIARKVARTIDRADPLPSALDGPVSAAIGGVDPALGGVVLDAGFARTVARMSDKDLKFYETTFLSMQRDILRDMGGLQEAYLHDPDNLTAIRELAAAGIIKPAVLTAFEHIRAGRDTGHGERVGLLDDAAQALARREQFDVIAQNWDRMRDHPDDGEAMTYFMTVVGQPSIPGAHSPGQVSPLELTQEVSVPSLHERWLSPRLGLPPVPVEVSLGIEHRTIVAHTPLPDFNVSERNARWRFFVRDTLPAALNVLDGSRADIDALVSSPLDERIASQRITRRLPRILDQLGPGEWSVTVRH